MVAAGRIKKVLVAGPASSARRAISEILEDASHFEVVASVEDGSAFLGKYREVAPDFVVLDDRLGGLDVEQTAHRLALERPICTLILVDNEHAATNAEASRQLRIFRLDRKQLETGDAVGRSAARTRLRLIAARAMEPRRTARGISVVRLTDDLREQFERTAPSSDDVKQIARIPLDLVTIISARAGALLVPEVLGSVPSTRVPTLVAIDEAADFMHTIRASTARNGLTVTQLDRTSHVRVMQGISVGFRDSEITVRGDIVTVRDQLGYHPRTLIESAATLRERGLTLLVEPVAPDLSIALRSLIAEGGHAAIVGSEADRVYDDVPSLSVEDTAWILRNATPRRV